MTYLLLDAEVFRIGFNTDTNNIRGTKLGSLTIYMYMYIKQQRVL